MVAQLGTAAVRGFQGTSETLDQNHVFATAKHFVHGQPENGTNGAPSDYSEHTMRSIFLYPFEEAVKNAHIEAVMPSYNQTMGGIPSNANPWLLKEVLRKEWGFKGITVSDYTAITQLDRRARGMLSTRRRLRSSPLSRASIWSFPSLTPIPSLVEAIRTGKISEAELDESVGRVLTAKFNAGLFERPLVDTEPLQRAKWVPTDHAKLARKVADEAIVLLKNQAHAPAPRPEGNQNSGSHGPNANKERLGGYSGLPSLLRHRAGWNQKAPWRTALKYVTQKDAESANPTRHRIRTIFLPYKAPVAEKDRRTDRRGS